MHPRELSRQLRLDDDPYLANRRAVTVLSLGAASAMGLIVLYQMGVIKHLPDLPGRRFNADKVDASEEAYKLLSTPDAALGFASYAATLTLAAAGGRDRMHTQPWLPLALAAKASVDALQAARLTRDQWVKHKAFCIWCLLAAGATFAALPLTLPEAKAAVRARKGTHAGRSVERTKRPHPLSRARAHAVTSAGAP